MEIKSDFLKGMHSFRGIGFVEVEGQLIPVCGSEVFNFHSGANVRYLKEQIQMVKAEERRKAVYLVHVNATSPGSTVIRKGSSTGPIIMEVGEEEGIPKGVGNEAFTYDCIYLLPPFRWRIPDLARMEEPAGSAATDPRPTLRNVQATHYAFFPDEFDSTVGSTFATEIWIP